jgi:hypothetical protein
MTTPPPLRPRVQIGTHGNSETSGLGDSIDYFISFDMIEAPEGSSHYSEQLVRLGGVHSLFTVPLHLAPPILAPPAANTKSRPRVDSSDYPRQSSHVDAVNSHLVNGSLAGMSALQLLHRHLAPVCGDRLQAPRATASKPCDPSPLCVGVARASPTFPPP